MSSSFSLLVVSLVGLLTFYSCYGNSQQFGPQVRYSQPQQHGPYPAQQGPYPSQQGPYPPQPVPYPQPIVRQNVHPYAMPKQSPYVYSHQRFIDPVTNTVVYHHSHAYNNNSHHEVRSWFNPEGRAIQPVVQRALAQPLPSLPQPRSFISGIDNLPQPLNTQSPVNQRNVEKQNNQRALEKSNELSSPVILKQAEPAWFSNIETIVSFIKSPTFLSRVGTLGSPSAFKSHIVGDKMSEDEKLNHLNMEKTGLNFSMTNDDCKPKLTTVKFGRIDNPEIIFNPSSVEILRCPQACFSWQFDCVPTKREQKNISIATYFTSGGSITRKVDSITIDAHVACACSCQSFAGCFANSKMGSHRLPPTP